MISTSLIEMSCFRLFRSDQNHLFMVALLRRNYPIFRNHSRLRRIFIHQFHVRDLILSVRKSLGNNSIRTYSSNTKPICWNCKEYSGLLKFTCVNCGVLQRPDPEMTYFELMDLPQDFNLDFSDISIKHKSLQSMFHPDKYVQKSKEEIDISGDYSRLVNKAYVTLKNPLTRGIYILNLNGLATDDDSVKMNQEFLMEILEKNEELENITDVKKLQSLQETISAAINDFTKMAAKAFQTNDLKQARKVLMKMKYFVNIESEIKKKKSDMGIVD